MGEVTLTGRGEAERVQSALATANLFDVLGVAPAVGRGFRPDEDRAGTPAVVIISHALWTRRFARDLTAIGASLLVDGAPHAIVGVMPESFRFASYPHETDVWRPFGLDTFTDRQYARGLSTLLVLGRLRPGVTADDAQTDVGAAAAALEREYPENNRARQMFIVPLEAQAASHIRFALVAVSAGVVLVLLIACANVVNLLLGRASARHHELAVRSVLGGSRRRIAAQLLVEHLVLALAAGAAGLLVAWLARDLLVRLPYNTPDLFTPWVARLEYAALNGRVLAFTLLSSLIVGVLVGTLPALQMPVSHAASLATGTARVTGSSGAMRLRAGLVVAEIAMAVVLLTAMGLMLATVARMLRVDPGFAPAGLAAIDFNLPASTFPESSQVGRFYDTLLERLRQTPGISQAGAVEYLPFSGLDSDTGVLFDGQPIPTPDRRPRAHYRAVSDGYFETMGIPIVAGRGPAATDRRGAPMIALINESAAWQWFPDARPLGRHVALDFEAMQFFPDRAPVFDLALGLRDIVGVVRDVRHSGLTEDAVPELYVPLAQRAVRKMTVVVRSSLDPGALQTSIRLAVASLDRDLPVAPVTTLPDLIAASMTRPRFNTTVITAFGLLALILAAIGIYGVMSYVVALRRRDIGIHIAVGATAPDVFRLVTKPMWRLALAGLGIGLAGALAAGPALSRLLFGVQPHDPLVLLSVGAVVIVTTAGAVVLPAVRALRIDPVSALRSQT